MEQVMFGNVEVVLGEQPTKRRVLVFDMIDNEMLLESDRDEERQSTRHKFKTVRAWHRYINRRDNKFERREVPQEAIAIAIEKMQRQIKYVEKVTR
jgi:hypothetical protein